VNDSFGDFVRKTLEKEMERRAQLILEEEIPKLQQKVEQRIRSEVGQMAAAVFRHIEFSRCAEELRISVKFFEKGESPR
jgi:hypothetical protein